MKPFCTFFLRSLPLLALSACATILEGSDQDLTIITDPPKASCKIMRNNQLIGVVPSTPGCITIEKTKHPITIICEKEGYETIQYLNGSGTASMTLGNILLGGPIGWAVDSATGSDNYYTTPVIITLVPREGAVSKKAVAHSENNSIPLK